MTPTVQIRKLCLGFEALLPKSVPLRTPCINPQQALTAPGIKTVGIDAGFSHIALGEIMNDNDGNNKLQGVSLRPERGRAMEATLSDMLCCNPIAM